MSKFVIKFIELQKTYSGILFLIDQLKFTLPFRHSHFSKIT